MRINTDLLQRNNLPQVTTTQNKETENGMEEKNQGNFNTIAWQQTAAILEISKEGNKKSYQEFLEKNNMTEEEKAELDKNGIIIKSNNSEAEKATMKKGENTLYMTEEERQEMVNRLLNDKARFQKKVDESKGAQPNMEKEAKLRMAEKALEEYKTAKEQEKLEQLIKQQLKVDKGLEEKKTNEAYVEMLKNTLEEAEAEKEASDTKADTKATVALEPEAGKEEAASLLQKHDMAVGTNHRKDKNEEVQEIDEKIAGNHVERSFKIASEHEDRVSQKMEETKQEKKEAGEFIEEAVKLVNEGIDRLLAEVEDGSFTREEIEESVNWLENFVFGSGNKTGEKDESLLKQIVEKRIDYKRMHMKLSDLRIRNKGDRFVGSVTLTAKEIFQMPGQRTVKNEMQDFLFKN